jgi:hypothetical protein
VEGIEKKQENANPDNGADNDRISSFAEVYPLNQGVQHRKAIRHVVHLRLDQFHCSSLGMQVFFHF